MEDDIKETLDKLSEKELIALGLELINSIDQNLKYLVAQVKKE
jgi:hypothetical protein